MRSGVSIDDEDSKSVFLWWRSAGENEIDGHLKIENVADLSPRIRVLREMERLALVASESLDDLRHRLLAYRSGDFWLPVGGIKKEDVDVPPVVTLLLVGFSGSGKSSLINLMYSVLGRTGLIPFAQTSGNALGPKTMHLVEHNVLRSMKSGFCIYDSRGLDYGSKIESFEQVTEWMEKGVRHRELCWREGDEWAQPPPPFRPSQFVTRRVNCPIVVAGVAEIYQALVKGDSKPLEATRELFHLPAMRNYCCDLDPILILTHGEGLSAEERVEGRARICEFLGISPATGAYDVACVTEKGFLAEEVDPVTAYSVTEAVYRALLISDRGHPAKKDYWDYVIECLTTIVLACSALLGFLAHLLARVAGGRGSKLKKK